MYRVIKILNHNSIIVLGADKKTRLLVMHKGIGFGKKTTEFIDVPDEAVVYSLEEASADRGDVMSIVKQVDPECLEIAGAVLDEAEAIFTKVDRRILFPMADHLSFAIRRMQNGEDIRNPLSSDIRLLFPEEYKAASKAVEVTEQLYQITLNEDEIGLLALHVHSAIENENVARTLQTTQIIRNCILYIEEKTQRKLEVSSLGYNRLMNHVRYMVTRMETGEIIKLNLNDYMAVKYPEIFSLSEDICNQISRVLKKEYSDSEKGYLAMHIARVLGEE